MTTVAEAIDPYFTFRLRSTFSTTIAPCSSPHDLAANAASRNSSGIAAWIDVISLAWRAKDS